VRGGADGVLVELQLPADARHCSWREVLDIACVDGCVSAIKEKIPDHSICVRALDQRFEARPQPLKASAKLLECHAKIRASVCLFSWRAISDRGSSRMA
jgi:hypothetical protein